MSEADFEWKRGWTYVGKAGVRRTIIDFDAKANELTYCNNDRRSAFVFHKCKATSFVKWIDARKTARLHARVRADLQIKQLAKVFGPN